MGLTHMSTDGGASCDAGNVTGVTLGDIMSCETSVKPGGLELICNHIYAI